MKTTVRYLIARARLNAHTCPPWKANQRLASGSWRWLRGWPAARRKAVA